MTSSSPGRLPMSPRPPSAATGGRPVQPPFELRALVREVMSTSTIADPHVLADAVMERIGPRQTRAALRACLGGFVRQVMFESGTRGLSGGVKGADASGSRKVEAIRNMWQRELRNRVYVGASWVFLADCTRDDLLAAAQYRRDLAARNCAKAQQFEALAALLDEHDAATVSDLLPTVLRGALTLEGAA